MDSINEVMEAVKAYCKEQTSDATYGFYIKDIRAVSFENSKVITLELRTDFIRNIVSDRYAALLKEAFKSVLGFDVDINFVTAAPAEGGDRPTSRSWTRARCPAGATTSPLKTSSKARRTSLRLRPRRPSRRTRPARTTRCSSTGRRAWARRIC